MGEGRHTVRCEKATQSKCVCKGCGGTEHGWPGAVHIASDASGRELAEFVGAADEQWKGLARVRNHRGEPTDKARKAAIKGSLGAVVTWLHRDGDLRGRLAAIGEPLRGKPRTERQAGDGTRRRRTRTPDEQDEFVDSHVIPRLDREFGTSKTMEFQSRAVETHFWCELLAQTARALAECQGMYEEAKRSVVAILTESDAPHPAGWERVMPHRDMMYRAVDLVFELLPRAAGLPAAEDVFRLLWPVRVLACLMCKDPSRHPAVRKHCLYPILCSGAARVRQEVHDRMGLAFPAEWPCSGCEAPGAA